MWVWLCWGGRRKWEYPTMSWMSWTLHKTHRQLLYPSLCLPQTYSWIRALRDWLIDWCQQDMNIIFFSYYYEWFPPYGFSEWKSKLTSVSWMLCWSLLLCDPNLIQLFWGQWSYRGRRKILLSNAESELPGTEHEVCYRAGDAFCKEEWNSALTQLYIMVVFGCFKLLDISGGF